MIKIEIKGSMLGKNIFGNDGLILEVVIKHMKENYMLIGSNFKEKFLKSGPVLIPKDK
ncbi:MAG: hypothetical protein IJA10_11895 [Lachnospiraceae bacterium]|nr:hypothetical protein [Lachnospiraceae bacterium]